MTTLIKNILKYYSFLVLSLMGIIGFLNVNSLAQMVSAVLFYPLTVYIWLQIVPRRKRAIELPVVLKTKKRVIKKAKTKKQETEDEAVELALEGEEIDTRNIDIDKRAFIKLIGSAGMSVFMLSLFTKKAQAAFFGSVPGPGTVALKDTSGNQIDPAEKHPTDGYKVVQLDDGTTSYYGFQNKDGAWFIMQEDASGNYRYTKGSSDFTNATTGWPNRADLTYGYFETIF